MTAAKARIADHMKDDEYARGRFGPSSLLPDYDQGYEDGFRSGLRSGYRSYAKALILSVVLFVVVVVIAFYLGMQVP